MNVFHPISAPRPGTRFARMAATVLLLSACTATPDASPGESGSPGPGSPSAGASAPTATREPGPTSPLFGQPPPLDPCELLLPTEIQSVLEGPYFTTEQESSRGAAYTCIFETESREDRVAVTVRKPPVTLEEFIRRMEGFGERATAITDLGGPAASVVFGPTATVYTLHEDVQFYIDVVRGDRPGGEISPLALGLMERALARLRADDAGAIWSSHV
ncbi:MAG: DUF3558 family protein [Chloroflexota bacterium]|nr:DUF3558 family protein [Chloroflexota bacterium]